MHIKKYIIIFTAKGDEKKVPTTFKNNENFKIETPMKYSLQFASVNNKINVHKIYIYTSIITVYNMYIIMHYVAVKINLI